MRRRRELARKNKRTVRRQTPSVEINLDQGRTCFQPGTILSCEYSIKLPEDLELAAVESSVIWKADGKGDEDIGVHFFERRNRATFGGDAFERPQRLSTVLPASPLSYDGKILKIGWQVRIRLFMEGGREFIEDAPFLLSLGDAPCRLVSDDEEQ